MTLAWQRTGALLASMLVVAPANAQSTDPAPEQQPETETKPETEPDTTKPSLPEPTPGVPPAPASPADPSTSFADKRIGVGIDGMLVIPVGEFGDATGALFGPVVRFGYRFIPAIETSLRAGYLFAVARDAGGGLRTKLDLLPVWIEARWFILETFTGPYAAISGGVNIYVPTIEPPIPGPIGDRLTEIRGRWGANLGAGAVLSASLPIDLRAQLVLPNLIGKESALKESTHFGVAFSVGYTLQF